MFLVAKQKIPMFGTAICIPTKNLPLLRNVIMLIFLSLFCSNLMVEIQASTNSTTGDLTVKSEQSLANQTHQDVIKSSTARPESTVPSVKKRNHVQMNLSLCQDDDNYLHSSDYCKCSNDTVSCDFSTWNKANRTEIFLDAVNVEPSVKRICICNTPRNVYVQLVYLVGSSSVHRLDFFNLTGPLSFSKSALINFGGDVYLSNVYLTTIRSFQFPRNDIIPIEDVHDLECCSKIDAPTLERPALYIENSTIGRIEAFGIYPSHMWKTVTFKFTEIRSMDGNGIILQDNVNASFCHTFFNSLANLSFVVGDVENFVLYKSIFNHTCHPVAFIANAPGNSSTIALIGNRFLNVPQVRLDAKWIISWFNFYDVWDNDTFLTLNTTSHEDRVYAIEFNTVDRLTIQTADLPAPENNSSVFFNENILSLCNCSYGIYQRPLPRLLSTFRQRCDSSSLVSTKNSKCTLPLQKFSTTCNVKDQKQSDVERLCQDLAADLIRSDTLENVPTNATGLFYSPFLLNMMRDQEKDIPYRMQKVIKYKLVYRYTDDNSDANDKLEFFEDSFSHSQELEMRKHPEKVIKTRKSVKTGTGEIIGITLSVIVCTAGLACIAYFLKRRFFGGGNNQYMSLRSY